MQMNNPLHKMTQTPFSVFLALQFTGAQSKMANIVRSLTRGRKFRHGFVIFRGLYYQLILFDAAQIMQFTIEKFGRDSVQVVE